MSNIRLAIAGIGNCANSLIQGLKYYADADPDQEVPGLMHVELGGYHIRDIELVAAFDVDATKVGQDVGKAMWAGLNNTIRFADVGDLGVRVQRAPTLDGFGKYYALSAEESPAELEALVAHAGLRLVERYGDFEGGPLGPGSDSQVLVCARSRRRRG